MSLSGQAQALNAEQAKLLDTAVRLLRSGKRSDALALGRRLAAEATRAPDAQQLLAMCCAETGDIAEADKAFRRALELAPNSPLVLINYAGMLRKSGRADEAIETYRRAANVAPDFAKAWIELGMTALEAGKVAQALESLERAVKLQPDSAFAWHALGNARRAGDQIEAAETAFRKSVELAPGSGTAWVNLGVALRLLGRTEEALACFDRAARAGYAGPELGDACAGTLLDSGRLAESVEQARRLTREYPDFVPGYLTLAHLLWEHGPSLKQENAVDMFRAAVLGRPQNLPLRLALVNFLLSAGVFEEALVHIRALQAHGFDPVLTALEADALESLGRSAQAGVLYAQVHGAGGKSDPTFLNSYARHLLRAGKWEAAAERAVEATRIDPYNQEAWAYLATLWRLMEDPREHWLCDYDRLIALVEVEPPAGFSSNSDFLLALRSTLEPLHQATREPLQQTLRGGSQTPGRLFGRPNPVIAATESAMRQAVERWLPSLSSDASHPFLMRKARSVRFSGSWSVRLWSSGRHVNHIHPEGWMSSAFYVSLPPSVAAQSTDAGQAGYIQFGQPPVELGLDLPPRRIIRPEPGKLAVFPSYMWHGTIPFEDDQPRLTVAFDMVPA
jgi:tetratricopeptide (TPR) repeat protein